MDYLTEYKPLIKKGLDDFIAAKRQKKTTKDLFNDLLDRLQEYVTSGKLLRGSLVCYSYSVCSGRKPGVDVLNAAMAIELVHTGLLVQDDIMDHDDYRRGLPAFHYQYAGFGRKLNLADADNFGVSMAICGSDMAIFFGYELLAGSTTDNRISTELQTAFSDTLVQVCRGQMLDIYWEESTDAPTKEDIFDLMRAKTASYSIALPLSMGAMLAGSTAKVKAGLHDIGVDAGTIFQIRDDELGVFGDQDELGKPVGADIISAKKTLLYHYLHDASTQEEKTRLRSIFGNEKAGKAEIDYVRAAMRRRKVPELLARDVEGLKKSAMRSIAGLDMDEKISGQLRNLVEFCAERQA